MAASHQVATFFPYTNNPFVFSKTLKAHFSSKPKENKCYKFKNCILMPSQKLGLSDGKDWIERASPWFLPSYPSNLTCAVSIIVLQNHKVVDYVKKDNVHNLLISECMAWHTFTDHYILSIPTDHCLYYTSKSILLTSLLVLYI